MSELSLRRHVAALQSKLIPQPLDELIEQSFEAFFIRDFFRFVEADPDRR